MAYYLGLCEQGESLGEGAHHQQEEEGKRESMLFEYILQTRTLVICHRSMHGKDEMPNWKTVVQTWGALAAVFR